jgi:hypothetical protein
VGSASDPVITVGTKYYYKGFGAPFQIYTIESIVKNKLYTTESSAGMNNNMNKWFNLQDFLGWIKRGEVILV